MKKGNWIYGFAIFAALGLILYFSPNVSCMLFVGIMAVLLIPGFFLGIFQVDQYAAAFCRGTFRLSHLERIAAEDNWLYIRQGDSFFQYEPLDKLFRQYQDRIERQRGDGEMAILEDIEDIINEDLIELKTLRSVVNFVPGALTGIGILGTFYGLVTGLGGIRFSSADVVIASVSMLVSEIDTAFYTSIAGVALSLLFELTVKMEWNYMLEKMREFTQGFQRMVIPPRTRQMDLQRQKVFGALLKYLEETSVHEKTEA